MVVRNELLERKTQLPDIIQALNSLRFSFGAGNCRKHQSRQNSDNGDNHQQFSQTEAVSIASAHI